MKQLFMAGLIAGMIHGAHAQSDSTVANPEGGRYNPGPAVTSMATDSTLIKMPKVELAALFLSEVTRVTNAIAHLPLDSMGGDVPANSYTKGKKTKVGAKVDKYTTTLINHYSVIIPYADKTAIIAAIVYLQGIPTKP